MRISDWSSDVCSSDLGRNPPHCHAAPGGGCMIDLALIGRDEETKWIPGQSRMWLDDTCPHEASGRSGLRQLYDKMALAGRVRGNEAGRPRSEEHTSELQSLMRISYAVFCLKKKK